MHLFLLATLLLIVVSGTLGAQTCGGVAGLPCTEPGTFCLLPDGACCCDFFGECQQVSEACPAVCEPVCGCDGVTYDNRCVAWQNSMSILHEGVCDSEPPPAGSTHFTTSELMVWTSPEPQPALDYNIYWQDGLPSPRQFSGRCLYADAPEETLPIHGEPDPGQVWMFQVTALYPQTGEGSMGASGTCGERDPQSRCVCTLPADVGPCDADIPRWYYDHGSGTCQLFSWGGCEGNKNNFTTQAACEATCLDPCAQAPEVGDCDAAIPRWYYSELSGECELFVWGGCNPGLNNFVTQADCEASCGN